ncbi:MAG: tetratricopeptide repeat protein [Deltaproteobacteria bacterium]|nr:tetratricopeptide repeat protein [Deltaproteobacteria bacterium]
MSLILDALKKAEKEQNPNSGNKIGGSNPIIADTPPSQQRHFVWLIVLLVISLSILLYARYFKKSSPTFIPQPKAVLPITETSQNVLRLKGEANQLFQENKLIESQALWEKLTLLSPTDAEVYNNLGLVLKKLGKKQNAYQAYGRALALQKDYAEALNNLGVLLLEDGAKEQAKTHFQKAISLKKNYADPHFNLGLIFEQEGNVKQASSNYSDYLQLAGTIDDTLKEKIEAKIKQMEAQ